MANIEFEDFVTEVTEETTPDNAADFLVIVDTSGSDVNKVKPSSILGTDLTAIKALTPSNDDVLQRKAGAWINRTIAQLTSDLGITSNATHTGDVTGSGALTVDKTAITGKTLVTAAVGDHVLVADASDSDNLKKATLQTVADLALNGMTLPDSSGTLGYLNIPQNIQSVNYTTVAADAGKHLYHALGAGAGDTYTIAANASVAYVIGTAITFVNMATDSLAVNIASDTLNYVGVGAVTTITIPQYNMVTAVKITSTAWLCSGTVDVTTA